MRVLLLTQYFPPETGGTSNRLSSFLHGLRAAGHDVHVLTAKPNHPNGVIWDGYRGGLSVSDEFAGAPVTRVWVWQHRKRGGVHRLLFYFSFVLSSVLASLRIRGGFDAVIASSPPLPVCIAGAAISRLKRARYVADVRDLWPALPLAMGELEEGWAAGLARRMERMVYRSAHGITAATSGFCRDIGDVAPAGTPIVRISNGTVPETFRTTSSQAAVRSRLGLPDKIIIGYVGNVGLAQGLDHVLEAAASMRDDDRVLFLFVGDGPVKDRLQAQATDAALPNVRFVDRVPLEDAVRYMAAADALLVPLGDDPIYAKVIPSKLFDTMASGRPVLLSVDGEARAILDEAAAGWYYPAEDAAGLVAAVKEIAATPAEADARGARGAAFVQTHYRRDHEAARLAEFVERVARGS